MSDAALDALASLTVSAQQDIHGGSFTESLEAWHKGPRDCVLGLAILHAETPVGLCLFKRPPASPDWARTASATCHGLKIATPWQGRGWGHAAFALCVRHMGRVWPDVDRLMLAVDADNHAALKVYRGFGMTEPGPIEQGRVGPEHRLEIRMSDIAL
ncbi:GNAT family N-acetyltransferase [Gymnodinialimonas sp.]